MASLINTEVFLRIFQNPIYRKKLDIIILDFFGMSPMDIEKPIKSEKCVILEFIICIEKQKVMNISIVDTKHIFENSKKFYINFCLKDKNRSYVLLYPCYWEFYCGACARKTRKMKNIELFAAILAMTEKAEIKKAIKKLKIFHKQEINDIMKKIDRK